MKYYGIDELGIHCHGLADIEFDGRGKNQKNKFKKTVKADQIMGCSKKETNNS